MTMLPGDWLALIVAAPVLAALTYGHLRAARMQRRAQRELNRLLGLS